MQEPCAGVCSTEASPGPLFGLPAPGAAARELLPAGLYKPKRVGAAKSELLGEEKGQNQALQPWESLNPWHPKRFLSTGSCREGTSLGNAGRAGARAGHGTGKCSPPAGGTWGTPAPPRTTPDASVRAVPANPATTPSPWLSDATTTELLSTANSTNTTATG